MFLGGISMIDRVSSHHVTLTSRTTEQNQSQSKQIQTSSNQVKEPEPQVKTEHVRGKLEDIVSSMNEFLQPSHTSIKFELHDKLNEYYVTVVDDRTHEVLKEIPSKKLLDIYAAMTEFLGLIVDKKI
jgi:flagellar protein FlaG